MCKLGKSGKHLGSQSSDILIFTLEWYLDLYYFPLPMCLDFCRNETQPREQAGATKCSKPDPQLWLVFQHVLTMHPQFTFKYGPCIMEGIFSTGALISTLPKEICRFVLNVSFSAMKFQLSVLNKKAYWVIL